VSKRLVKIMLCLSACTVAAFAHQSKWAAADDPTVVEIQREEIAQSSKLERISVSKGTAYRCLLA
jgi:hypothetical protein